jgi:predicted DNA-binding transcriptional regulator AlpA
MPPIEDKTPSIFSRLEKIVRDLYGPEAGAQVLVHLQALVMSLSEDRIVDWPEVLDRTRLSKRTVQRLMQENQFPPRVSISGSRTGWRNSDLVHWMRNLPLATKEEDGNEE